MNVAFLTEIGFEGKIPANHTNMRTELCWMFALDAYHYNIWNYNAVKSYDVVFVIIPKGDFFLSAVGCKLVDKPNAISPLLKSNFTEVLKENNKKICFIQEGSTTLFNDWSVEDQFYYLNHLQNFDILFSHNTEDIKYYKGMFPNKKVSVIPTLMLTHLLNGVGWQPQNKVMIGGNFSRFYGGLQSYIIADEFKGCTKWTMDSHSKREDESSVPDLNHLQRLTWLDWMKELSTYKFSVHMMSIVAAGTFALNNAFFSIPCIGNRKVDTQKTCFQDLSVDVDDIEKARYLAKKLNDDIDFYNQVSNKAIELSRNSYHINTEKWKTHILKAIDE